MPCECRTEKWMEGAVWEDAYKAGPDAPGIRRVRAPGGWLYREEANYYMHDDEDGFAIEGTSVSICFVPHPCGGE